MNSGCWILCGAMLTAIPDMRHTPAENCDAVQSSVRELSENATLRPAPRQLRCIPLRPVVLVPAPKWQAQRNYYWLAVSGRLPSPVSHLP